mmetsp:Transcript_26338/g.60673  ORF Transcript_26338/g.60673 Transcript_26338/m.60673 type:complete len:240 (+) Transcript_26338:523-1242(+)
MIGYCAPTTEFDECDTFDVATLSDAIEAAVALNAASATYVDSTGACGGSPSKAAYMVDAIHANNRGYCTLYTTLDAQEALACSPIKTEVDCKKVSKNVPKKPTPVAPSAPAPIPAPVPNSTPAPVPAPAPVPQPECEDNDKMKFNLKGGKKRKCSQLKKSECSKWDKKKGYLVSNYCLKLCDTCSDPKKCKDFGGKLIEKETKDKFKCKDIDEEFCEDKDKKKRLVREFCRGLCNFCEE